MEKVKARTNLKVFRTQQKMSQEDMAFKIGCTRATYSSIESGKRTGRQAFWLDFQKAFNIPDADLWGYMKLDEE